MQEKWVIDPGKGTDWHGYVLKIAIGFPGDYRTGMANLGLLWVQHLFNRHSEVRCDRFFESNRQLKYKERLSTIETGRPVCDYDVIALTMPYEGGLALLPGMLMAGGVEPLSGKRIHGPLIIAGGPAASANPEPVADFVDAVAIGDAESMADSLIGTMIEAKLGNRAPLTLNLVRDELRKIDGIYIPSDYTHRYSDSGGLISIEPDNGAREKVSAVRIDRIEQAAYSTVVTGESAFSNRFLVEASRGCPFRCRFCLASHTGGDFRGAENLVETIESGLEVTDRIGLIGTAFTKNSDISEACGLIGKRGANVSFSSIRMDPGTLETISDLGSALDLESIAVAPEVATSRLAGVVGKNVLNDLDVFVRTRPIDRLRKLRLYFLIGVPGENDDDAAAIAEKALEIRKETGWMITLSVTPMIPKPFTPMQWAGMADIKKIQRRTKIIRRQLAGEKGVQVKFESPRESVVQAVIARGDRRLGGMILEKAMTVAQGLESPSWESWFSARGPEADEYAYRERGPEEVFPWDVIDHGVEKTALYGQYCLAMKAAEK
ncbi:MAG TPA: radical SAM protein [bacterium]|nr:radical SAM protein [bacterium]